MAKLVTKPMKLQPNPNHDPSAGTAPPVSTPGPQSEKIWTGCRNRGHLSHRKTKHLPLPPPTSRVAKEALYLTGSRRIYERRSGTGRPINEPPKKAGAGKHNWGWPGMEIGVELADREKLGEIDREFNPTAPEPGEEPTKQEQLKEYEEEAGEEEWAEGDEELARWTNQGTGWEWEIAGATRMPGYWEGLEGVRTLFGEEVDKDTTFEKELPHADWDTFAQAWAEGFPTTSSMDTSKEEEEEMKKVALKVGGTPKWSEIVAWGNPEAKNAAFEGAPVIPWGEEPEPENIGKAVPPGKPKPPPEDVMKLCEEGPLGLEAERLMRGKKEEAPARFINPDIKTPVRLGPTVPIHPKTEGEPRSAEEGAKIVRFNIADSVSPVS